MAGPLGESLDALVRFDHATLRLIYELRGPLVTKFLTSVTGLGSAAAAAVFLGTFWLADWEGEFNLAAAALALTGVVVVALMATFQRPFPPDPVCVTEGAAVARSFPSGHAAGVAAFAAVARRSRELPFLPVAALASLVAFSRVYLGTHYLSDTLVGVLIGLAAVALAGRALARFDYDRPERR